MKKKTPIKRPKKSSKTSATQAKRAVISVAGGAARVTTVRGGVRIEVSSAREDDPQGGCVTCFPYPTEPYIAKGDFIVWCEQGKCDKECHVHETWDDDKGSHDVDQGPATEKKPFHYSLDEKKKDRHFQCRCDEKK